MATLIVVTSVAAENGSVSTSSVAIPYEGRSTDAVRRLAEMASEANTLPSYMRVDYLVLP